MLYKVTSFVMCYEYILDFYSFRNPLLAQSIIDQDTTKSWQMQD